MLLIACVPQRQIAIGNADGRAKQRTHDGVLGSSSAPGAMMAPQRGLPREQQAGAARHPTDPRAALPVAQEHAGTAPAHPRSPQPQPQPQPSLQSQPSAAFVVSPLQALPLNATPAAHASVLPQAADGSLLGAWVWWLVLLAVWVLLMLLLIQRTRRRRAQRAAVGTQVVARLRDTAGPGALAAALPRPSPHPAQSPARALHTAPAPPAPAEHGEPADAAQPALPSAVPAVASVPSTAPLQPRPLVFDAVVTRSWSVQDHGLEVWEYWMTQPAVDFGIGCEVLPQPASHPAAAIAADAGQVGAGLGQALSPPPGGCQGDLPSTHAGVSLQQQMQLLLDEALGAGATQVQSMPGTQLPQLPAGSVQMSAASLQALYSALGAVKQSRFADWMRAQLLLASAFTPLLGSAQQSHDAAMAMTHGEQNSTAAPTTAHWQALRLRLQLAWLQRSGTAACLLGLTKLRQEHAAMSARGELPVLLAWREVLICWAGLQQGAAALARHAEAEAVCMQVSALPEAALLGQQLLAETLLLRARHDRGGLRDETLRRAAAVAQAALARQPVPALSLTAANIALARAELLADTPAADLFEQALTHAMDAALDTALQPAALQCRLAIQLAYEALAGGTTASPAALGLAERLQGVSTLAAETWQRIVAVQMRSGRFEQACQLAAQAARQQHPHADLLALWEQASNAWQAQQPQGAQHHAWQDNVRARMIASLSHLSH